MRALKMDSSGSVLIETDQGFSVWMDVFKQDNDIVADWNKYIFHLNNSKDIEIQKFQNNNFELASEIAIDFYKSINERIDTFLNTLETANDPVGNYITAEQIEDYSTAWDTIAEAMQDNLDVQIIYYYKALEYLREHDCSLTESLELAADFGFTPENLNSEVLASLLASEKNRSDFYDLENEITGFFDGLLEDGVQINEHEIKVKDFISVNYPNWNIDKIYFSRPYIKVHVKKK